MELCKTKLLAGFGNKGLAGDYWGFGDKHTGNVKEIAPSSRRSVIQR